MENDKFDRGLLQSDMVFYGKHAEMINRLKQPISTDFKTGLFKSTVDLLIAASQIGIIEKKTAKKDTSTDESTKIFSTEMQSHHSEIAKNFRMIMLLHGKNNGINPKVSLENAFLYDNKPEERATLEDIFYGYVLGGIEIIYTSIFGADGKIIDTDEVLRNAFQLVEKVQGLTELCSAKSSKDILLSMGD